MEYLINYDCINFEKIKHDRKKLLFLKDKNLIFIESSLAMNEVAKVNSLIGKSDYDLRWDFLYDDCYRLDDQAVLNGSTIEKMEPFYKEEFLDIVRVKKAPVFLNNEVIGIMGEIKVLYSTSFSKNDVKKLDALIPKLKNKENIFKVGENFLDLTKRQSACLFYYVRGKSAKKIAKLLKRYDSDKSLDYRTVESNLRDIMIKWRCNNKTELEDIAFEKGFFMFIPIEIIFDIGVTTRAFT